MSSSYVQGLDPGGSIAGTKETPFLRSCSLRSFQKKGLSLSTGEGGRRYLSSRCDCLPSSSRVAVEFFFHSMGGREGIVDTAVKTSATGYIQRREVKAMESHTVRYDGTVRNSSDHIVQFSYGGNGWDGSWLERIPLEGLSWSSERMRAELGSLDAERSLALRDVMLPCRLGPDHAGFETRVALPFNVRRMAERVGTNEDDGGALVDVDEAEAFHDVVEAFGSATLSYSVRLALPTSKLTKTFTKTRLSNLVRLVRRAEARAKVCSGEAVGCIAAQSIGEPTTQMTLNTFHFAGCAAKNVTLGIPRLQELLTVSRNPKICSTAVHFVPPFCFSASFAQDFATAVPCTMLSDVVAEYTVERVGDCAFTDSETRARRVHFKLNDEDDADDAYFLRIHLAERLLYAKKLTVPLVLGILEEAVSDEVVLVGTESNDVDCYLHLHAKGLGEAVREFGLTSDKEAHVYHRMAHALTRTVVLCGHPDISEAQVREVCQSSVVADAEGHCREDTRTAYVVDVTGRCMSDLTQLAVVDWYSTTCNDVSAVQSTLGINAAVDQLYNEFTSVISFDGTCTPWPTHTRREREREREREGPSAHALMSALFFSISLSLSLSLSPNALSAVPHTSLALLVSLRTDVYSAHIGVIVDTMCKDGRIKPLNRFGVNREHGNPLARATYEETPDILCESAMLAERSTTQGVSACIMLGQRPDVGTGVVNVEYHTSMLPFEMQASTKCNNDVVVTKIGDANLDVTTLPTLQFKVNLSDVAYDVHDSRTNTFTSGARKRLRSP